MNLKICHLLPHLGGGVGKALSGLASQTINSSSGVQHLFICLERPKKSQFVDLIRDCGYEVIVCPARDRLEEIIGDVDIVQLEWWSHPATIKSLCSLSFPPIRFLIWCHVSGLHNPIIPQRLILASQKFLFTSPCSLEAREVVNVFPQVEDRLDVVSSSGGFDELPKNICQLNEDLSVGYIGSLNFAKLHPQYVDYLSAVDIPGFNVKLVGDITNQDILNKQCDVMGKAGMLDFRGYTPDIVSELTSINVLAYILNQEHYGTTENALLEAMAMGIVPIVLDNACERHIVDDHKTGLIVNSPYEFAEAMDWLYYNPDKRKKLGKQAARSVRKRFTAKTMEASLNRHYQSLMTVEKREVVFADIFGSDPADWFLSCQENKSIFAKDGNINFCNSISKKYILFEKSKGSVFHFNDYFPDNLNLRLWAKNLNPLQ